MLEVLPSSDAHNNSRRQVRKNDQDGTKRTKRDRSTSALSPTKPPSKTTRASKVAAATAAASPTKKVATLEDSNSNSNARRRRRHRPGAKDNGTSKGARTKSSKAAASTPPPPPPLELSLEEQERYIAMDCEMVGVGPYGTESALARVTLLNWQGQVVLDAWVRPAQPVTDYRTFVSGITPQDLTDETSPHVLLELDTCRNLVRQQIANKIVIGHALKNDFHALQIYDHPWYLQRDTAKYEPFLQKQDNNLSAATTSNKSTNGSSSSSSSCGSSSDEATPAFSSSSYCYSYNDWHVRRPKARKLKDLVQEKLHRTIQPPGAVHSPIEDALGALDLYKLVRVKWEKCMAYKIAKTQEILLSQHHQEQQQTTLSSSSVEKSDAMLALASDHDEVATAASTSQSEDSTFEADYEEFPAEIPVLVVTDNDDNNNNNDDEDDDDDEEDNQDDDDEQLLC